MLNSRATGVYIFWVLAFTLAVISFWFYRFIFWALGALWHLLTSW